MLHFKLTSGFISVCTKSNSTILWMLLTLFILFYLFSEILSDGGYMPSSLVVGSNIACCILIVNYKCSYSRLLMHY